jgi:hypothetical protein
MTDHPHRARPALTGWAAAALAVSGSLAIPACAGETTDTRLDDGGVAGAGSRDAASESPFSGGGICAVFPPDSGATHDASDDAAAGDAAADDAGIDVPNTGGTCATAVP